MADDNATRECADCGEHKPGAHFYRYRSGAFYNRCKPCHYARTQRWRAANRDKIRRLDRERYPRVAARVRAGKRLRKYGLTAEAYDALIERQRGVCPICLEPLIEPIGRTDSADWALPSIDHCHDTGAVRGVLHRRCNLALEFLLTEVEAARARHYLRGATK